MSPRDPQQKAGGEGLPVKRSEEIVEILEAFDLTGSYRAAAELAVTTSIESELVDDAAGRPGSSTSCPPH